MQKTFQYITQGLATAINTGRPDPEDDRWESRNLSKLGQAGRGVRQGLKAPMLWSESPLTHHQGRSTFASASRLVILFLLS